MSSEVEYSVTAFAPFYVNADRYASLLANPAQAVDELVTPHRWMIGYARLIHKDSAPLPGCNWTLRVFSYGGRFSADRFSHAPIV